jgi:hypothetical protein
MPNIFFSTIETCIEVCVDKSTSVNFHLVNTCYVGIIRISKYRNSLTLGTCYVGLLGSVSIEIHFHVPLNSMKLSGFHMIPDKVNP